MSNLIDVIKTRRCVRSYKTEQIKEAELNAVLEAGIFAPSAMNRQPCKIVVLQDKELIYEAGTVNPERGGVAQYHDAPTVIMIFADKNISTYIQDASAITTNILNAAHSIGVDSCWVHIPPRTYESDEGKKLLAKLGLSENYAGVASVTLGYTDAEYPQAKPRKVDVIKRF